MALTSSSEQLDKMKKKLLLVSLGVASIGIASGSLDTDKIDRVTGLKGKLSEKEGVYKVHVPAR